MEKRETERAGLIALTINIFLFIIKLIAGILSGSLAVLSDAFNSFLDILSYFLAFTSIKLAAKGPDADHPFGHRRAEPLSALVVAIFTGIVGFEILRTAAENILSEETLVTITIFTFIVLLISIALKSMLYFYLGKKAKKHKSTSLEALAVDSKNDALTSFVALLGVWASSTGIFFMDKLAAIVIAIYIIYAGYNIARKNIGYLMGRSPRTELTAKLWNTASGVKGIKRISNLRAHYVGDRVHVEVEIVLSKKLKPEKTHEIGENVQNALEKIDLVQRAFIHIDYE